MSTTRLLFFVASRSRNHSVSRCQALRQRTGRLCWGKKKVCDGPSSARIAVNHPRDTIPDANSDLWTLTQAADFLRVSRKELLELIRQGELRYVQRGLRIRIHREELERYRERATS